MRFVGRNKPKIFLLAFAGMVFFGFLLQEDTQAYWNESQDKTVQCFAVQYEKQEEHNDPVTGNVGGTQVQRVISGAYSTVQICAKVDSSGKVVGDLYKKDKPKDTSSVKSFPQLAVDPKNKQQINMLFCGDGSAACGSGVAPLSYSYSVKNKTFKEVASLVVSQAPNVYNNNNSIKKMGLEDNITKTSAAKKANETNSDNYEEAAESGYGNKCIASGGAFSLGWIVCPILEWMSDAATSIYDEYVEPSLQIEPQLFNDESSSAWDAWSTFRDFANIAFVILFLFVIFSQLTGIGIDNYGIKKILPKLIVAAVLINLSYVICVLAVDVSNILGNSFQDLFKSLGDGLVFSKLNIEGETINLMDQDNSLLATGLTGVGLLALLGGGTFAFLGNPAILLSLLVSALGIVISIFFLFILLSMREAAIIVLVVIAPLAFVVYMLPNTKKLFDKWLNFFKGLLIVYPVCGLLVGGGNYVSKLLLATNIGGGGFITAFTAMIVGVLPIFFIPMVIRSAFNAMGTIGSRLANLGNRMGSRATGAIRDTERYKNASQYLSDIGAAGRAQGVVNRLGGRNNLSRRQRYRLLDAQKTLNAQTARDAEAEVGAFPLDSDLAVQRAQSAVEAQELKAYQDQFAGFSREQLMNQANTANTWLSQRGGQQRMSALISAMESRGMESDIFNTLRNNNMGGMSGVMQTLANSNNKVLKAYGKTGNGVSYNDFMNGGMYRDARGNITNSAVDANGNANTAVSMQRYASEKGGEFVNGLDDKALAEISRIDNNGQGVQIMNTGQLAQAAANLNDEASMREINTMLDGRNDLDGMISGEQLAQFNASTLSDLESRSHNDVNVKNAILRASNAIAADPKLIASMNSASKDTINAIRATRNLPPIP